MRALVSHYIGGGWGSEVEEHGTSRVAIIRGADFPAVASGDATALPIRWEATKKVSGRVLRPGDLVLEISGGTKDRPTGRTVYMSESLLGQNSVPTIPASFCRLIRPDARKVNPRYLYYWLQDMYRQGRTWSYQVQSTGLANFQMETFLDREIVRVPDPTEQHAIAQVLGALDDLIHENAHQIERLGGLASSVFDAFEPVAESATTFGEVTDVRGGGTPSTKNEKYWDGDIAWATPTDVTGLSAPYLFDTSRRITADGLDACASSLHPTGSILMTSRATIGAFALAQRPAATNQGFIVVLPRADHDRYFLYHEMLSRVDEFIGQANGSTFLELSRGRFKGLALSWPSDTERASFHRSVAPLHESASALVEENRELRRVRDELLPLLMSGLIRAADAEQVAS